MLATILCQNHFKGVSAKGNDYQLVNFIVSECKSAPYLCGQVFANFVKSDKDWVWNNCKDGQLYEVDLQLFPNKKEYANIHFSVSCCGFNPLSEG